MDTKLKSNKWGMLLAFLIVIGSAAGMMALYPWFKTLAFEGAQRMTERMAEKNVYSGYYAEIGGQMYSFTNQDTICGMVIWSLIGIGMMTALAALILALIRPLGMTEKWLFRTPFEVVAIIGTVAMGILGGLGYNFVTPVWSSIIGEVQELFMRELYLHRTQADAAVWIINFLTYLMGAALIYWGVTCLTAVFNMGIIRYIKERTITGRVIRQICRLFKKTYEGISSIDFREKSTKLILKVVVLNFVLLTILSCFWFFGIFGLFVYSVILYFLLRKLYDEMQEKYQVLLKATNQLADGNLDVEIKENLGVFEPFRGEIEKIQSGFRKAVDEEVKSQSMKTELVTNVSHDLKTPLTAIITYVNLLKKEGITEEERRSYIQVLDQKSMRLKSLIEDLFEISKANSHNVTLNPVEVDIVSLMKQVRLELDDKMGESQVEFKWNLPEYKIIRSLDSDKTYRVFENLLVNILKYSMPGTRAYVDIEEEDGEAIISMKNISATEISLNGAELSDRFVRGDSSRNTEGSGLGLAIAKSFVELQKGTFEVETEADLFKVRICFNSSPLED
ncbi:MAG: sensor histidine kinase [Clostridium sp.]